MKHEAVEGGTLWTNDTDIAQGVTIAGGTRCITLQPGESYLVVTVEAPAPGSDLGAVAAYAADANKMI